MSRKLLLFTSFFSGAGVMVLELLASRILAPYVGSTNLVWTVIIGLLLTAMSLGYFVGGRLADRHPRLSGISACLSGAALFLSFIPFLEAFLLPFLAFYASPSLAALGATLALFALPAVLLAAISPYIIKLCATNQQHLGQLAGKLSALSSVGSIGGTFFTGFVFLPFLGSHATIVLLTFTILLLAFILDGKKRLLLKLNLAAIIALSFLFGFECFKTQNPLLLADLDTQYSRLWILGYQQAGREIRVLKTANAYQTLIELNSDYISEYLRYFDLFADYNPSAQNLALIGGAGLSYPRHFVNNYPQKNLTVIEIDPQVTTIAKQYLGYRDLPAVTLLHDDGRQHLKATPATYDAILFDAFLDRNVPLHLVTKEAWQTYQRALTPHGTLVFNFIGSAQGTQAHDLNAVLTTAKTVFPAVHLFQVTPSLSLNQEQNFIILATANPDLVTPTSSASATLLANEITSLNLPSVSLLTDDRALYALQ